MLLALGSGAPVLVEGRWRRMSVATDNLGDPNLGERAKERLSSARSARWLFGVV